MEWVKPEEIETRSMQIIESEMPKGNWTPGELLVVKRCIHTSADFDYAENLYFSDHAVERAIELLKAGATIVTDTNMGMAGINKRALSALNASVRKRGERERGDAGGCQHGACGKAGRTGNLCGWKCADCADSPL